MGMHLAEFLNHASKSELSLAISSRVHDLDEFQCSVYRQDEIEAECGSKRQHPPETTSTTQGVNPDNRLILGTPDSECTQRLQKTYGMGVL